MSLKLIIVDLAIINTLTLLISCYLIYLIINFRLLNLKMYVRIFMLFPFLYMLFYFTSLYEYMNICYQGMKTITKLQITINANNN